MTRNDLAAIVLLLALGAPASGAGGRESSFTVKTLTPAERLELPFLKVPVGPDRPLAVRGREEEVRFVLRDGALRADATSAEGFETEIEPGRTVAVEIGRPSGEGPPPTAKFTFLRGDPGAGEPPWSVVSLDVLLGTIGEKVLVVDHDADGIFFTPHSDFIVRAKGRDLQPVSPVVVLGKRVYRASFDEGARTVEWETDEEFVTSDVFPGWSGVAEGLAHLNRIRGGMNLLPVALNRKASADTMLHVRYLALNGGNGHLEEEGKRGYTREGMRAGLNAIGSLNQGGVPATIEGHLTSLLHRMELIDPTVTEVGVAADSSRVWIHTECGKRRAWDGQGPVIFPGPHRAWNVGTYGGENPDPRPEGENRTSGLPVTVAWYGEESIREVKAELSGSRGRLRCWKNDSERRDLRSNHGRLRAVLMPQSSLKGRNLLLLAWEQDGRPCRLEYEFRIGRWK